MRIYGFENNEVILRELGIRIKDTRIILSFTQKELSERAGISQRTVERIENGENVKIDNLINVIRALDLLQNFEILVPEQKMRPTELHDIGKKRTRVTSKKEQKIGMNEWKWGDEE